MGRPKKEKPPEQPPVGHGELFPNGAHFGMVQLAIDLLPKPSAQRIVQWVNNDGVLQCYISENAYMRSEAIDTYDKLYRFAYNQSIAKGAQALLPVKGRLHWHRFSEAFCKTGRGPAEERVNPETGGPEITEPEENEKPAVVAPTGVLREPGAKPFGTGSWGA